MHGKGLNMRRHATCSIIWRLLLTSEPFCSQTTMSPLKYILADLDLRVWLSGYRGTVVHFLPALFIGGVYIMKTSRVHEIATLNPKKRWEFSNSRRRAEFMKYSKDLLTQGRKKFWHQPYKLYTDWGEVTVLSPECAEELRSDSRMEILPIVKDVLSSTRYLKLGYWPKNRIRTVISPGSMRLVRMNEFLT